MQIVSIAALIGGPKLTQALSADMAMPGQPLQHGGNGEPIEFAPMVTGNPLIPHADTLLAAA